MNKKKGQEQVKNSAKIVCFKCKVEGHHVRSCPLKKKPISDKQQGKRPQVHSHAQPIYSVGKDNVGNVFAKFVGAQSGVKKRTIWVAKPIVTNLLGPNLVGDQQAQT